MTSSRSGRLEVPLVWVTSPPAFFPLPSRPSLSALTWESLEDGVEEGAEVGRNCLPEDLLGVGQGGHFPWDHEQIFIQCP